MELTSVHDPAVLTPDQHSCADDGATKTYIAEDGYGREICSEAKTTLEAF